MDTLIKQAIFDHDDEQMCHAFKENVSQWKRENTGGPVLWQNLVEALTVLGDRLAKEPHPKYNTNGFKQALYAFQEIKKLVRDVLDNNQATLNEIQHAYFTFIMKLLQRKKKSILQIEIIFDCLSDRYLELRTYIQGLDGSTLKSMVKATCQNLEVEDDVPDKLGNLIGKFVTEIVFSTLKKEQQQENMKTLLDFALHLYLECMHLAENIQMKCGDCGKSIINALGDPFACIEDMEQLRCYIRLCGNAFKHPGFPSTKTTGKNANSIIEMLLQKLGKRCLIEETYNEVFDLILDISKCPSTDDDFVLRLFGEASSFFRRLEKKAIKVLFSISRHNNRILLFVFAKLLYKN